MQLSLRRQVLVAGTGAQSAGEGHCCKTNTGSDLTAGRNGCVRQYRGPVSQPSRGTIIGGLKSSAKMKARKRRTRGIRESFRQSRLNMRRKQDHDPCHPALTPEQHAERANGISQRHFMSISVTFLSQGTAPAGIARRYLLPSGKGCAYLDPRTRAPLTPHRMG